MSGIATLREIAESDHPDHDYVSRLLTYGEVRQALSMMRLFDCDMEATRKLVRKRVGFEPSGLTFPSDLVAMVVAQADEKIKELEGWKASFEHVNQQQYDRHRARVRRR